MHGRWRRTAVRDESDDARVATGRGRHKFVDFPSMHLESMEGRAMAIISQSSLSIWWAVSRIIIYPRFPSRELEFLRNCATKRPRVRAEIREYIDTRGGVCISRRYTHNHTRTWYSTWCGPAARTWRGARAARSVWFYNAPESCRWYHKTKTKVGTGYLYYTYPDVCGCEYLEGIR